MLNNSAIWTKIKMIKNIRLLILLHINLNRNKGSGFEEPFQFDQLAVEN